MSRGRRPPHHRYVATSAEFRTHFLHLQAAATPAQAIDQSSDRPMRTLRARSNMWGPPDDSNAAQGEEQCEIALQSGGVLIRFHCVSHKARGRDRCPAGCCADAGHNRAPGRLLPTRQRDPHPGVAEKARPSGGLGAQCRSKGEAGRWLGEVGSEGEAVAERRRCIGACRTRRTPKKQQRQLVLAQIHASGARHAQRQTYSSRQLVRQIVENTARGANTLHEHEVPDAKEMRGRWHINARQALHNVR